MLAAADPGLVGGRLPGVFAADPGLVGALPVVGDEAATTLGVIILGWESLLMLSCRAFEDGRRRAELLSTVVGRAVRVLGAVAGRLLVVVVVVGFVAADVGLWLIGVLLAKLPPDGRLLVVVVLLLPVLAGVLFPLLAGVLLIGALEVVVGVLVPVAGVLAPVVGGLVAAGFVGADRAARGTLGVDGFAGAALGTAAFAGGVGRGAAAVLPAALPASNFFAAGFPAGVFAAGFFFSSLEAVEATAATAAAAATEPAAAATSGFTELLSLSSSLSAAAG